ncbi:MAG: DUF1631 family protein [Pseudomonadota bacterium]|nr:DUF1631 family protein [Pseudomonadota bacterium]
MRLAINLDGLLSIDGKPPIPCTARDYCAGGMFISADPAAYASVAPQTPAIFYFALSIGGEKKDFQASLTIARAVAKGIGVSFRDPDPQMVEALKQLAAPAAAPPIPSSTEALSDTPGRFAVEFSTLVGPLTKLVDEHTRKICDRFFESTDEALLLAVRLADNNVDEKRFLVGLSEIRKRRDQVREEVPPRIELGISILGNPLSDQNKEPGSNGLSDLSLVDKEDFETFLAVSEIVSELEPEFSEPLFALSRRFTYLANRELDAASIPLGPSVLCNALADSLKGLQSDSRIIKRIYEVLHEVMSDNLGRFYEEVNALLVEHGILPVIEKDEPVIKKKPPTKTGVEAPIEGELDDTMVLPPISPGGVASAPPSAPPVSATAEVALPAVGGGGLPVGWVIPGGSYVEPSMQQVHSTAQTQMALRRQLLPDRAQTFSETVRQRGDYSRNQVAEGLTNVQHVFAETINPQLLDPEGVKRWITESLTGEGAPEKMIGEEANGAIEIVANLFSAMLDDGLAPKGAKRHLSGLQPSVHKAALIDSQFFESADHPVKQVINRIAQVRDGESQDDQVRNARVQELVAQVNDQFHDDVSVFQPVIEELDKILLEQGSDYERRVGEVIESCEKQQQVLEQYRDQSLEATNQTLERSDSPEAWHKWLERARQLELGQRMLMNANTANPIIETLVWKEARNNLFVFVDDLGNKASTLTREQVAMYLCRGILKPMESNENEPAMERAMFGVVDRFHSQLEQHATRDPLTGFLNRKFFVEEIDAALPEAESAAAKNAVLCQISIENLKQVNDEFGAEGGDALIEKFAQVLREEIRGKDLIFGRLGGTELGIYWPAGGIQNVHKKLQSKLESLTGISVSSTYASRPFAPEFVIGVIGSEDGLVQAEGLLSAVLEACNSAREMGIGSIYVAGSESQQRRQMERMVAYANKALERECLILRGQNVTNLNDGDILPALHVAIGARDRSDKLIPTQSFMPALARCDIAAEIDMWAFKQTLAWMVDHEDEVEKYALIVIPLSSASMKNEDLPNQIMSEFMETPVPPGKICFEIPDRDVVDNVVEAGDLISSMKEFGCRFVLDEFGSGHDNYDYIKELDVDFVTVKTGFVADAQKSPKDFAMAKSINELVHFMGKKTIAKQQAGLELAETMREIGIDFLYDLAEQAELAP